MGNKKGNSKGKLIFVGSGVSRENDAYKAGCSAVDMAIKNLIKQGANKGPDFAFVFCNGKKYGNTKERIKELVKGADETLKKSNKNVKWIGCTSTSEIIGDKTYEDSCVVLAAKSDYIHVGAAVAEIGNKDPKAAGRKLIRDALNDLKTDKYLDSYTLFLAKKKKNIAEDIRIDPYYFVYLPAGVTNNFFLKANEIIYGFLDVVGPSLQLIGGSAGDNFVFNETYQFADGKIVNKGAALMAIYSNLYVGLGSSHGFERKANETPLRITKCEGNILMEINGMDAIGVYAKTLKKTVEDVKKNILKYGMDYPIGILRPDGNYSIVSPFAIANDKYIRCAAFLNKGEVIDIVKASKQKMLKATQLISNTNKRKTKNSVALSLCFSCSMRKIKLAKDYIKEAKIATNRLKSNKLVGIYSYAEHITPEDGQARMVNETFTSISFSTKLINE
jgi:hypothetical protein